MNRNANRIFISYRRDDAAGYAGRLEESLERRFGRGSVFRDVLDIPPGEDFVRAIRARLAGAQAVLVLIGPRWAGGATPGTQRIDDPEDLVRMEVAVALEGRARVVPVLLPGAEMPAEDTLPEALKPLARRNALALSDLHWDTDAARLAEATGLPARRRGWPWAVAGAALGAAALAAMLWQKAGVPPDPAERILGTWQAEVTYDWGDRYTERFEFKRHAGELTGTASFLAHPRAIENVKIDGGHLRFETRTRQFMGNETRETTHHYSAELRGQPPQELLSLRMNTTGAFDSHPPLDIDAVRVGEPASAAAPR